MEASWLAQNWFQILTLFFIVVSWAVHYGISTQKWQSLRDEFREFKKVVMHEMTLFKDQLNEVETGLSNKIKDVEQSFVAHTNNSDIHVSATLLQLFNERSDFIKQQFTDTRNDISRLEGILSNDSGKK